MSSSCLAAHQLEHGLLRDQQHIIVGVTTDNDGNFGATKPRDKRDFDPHINRRHRCINWNMAVGIVVNFMLNALITGLKCAHAPP